MEQLVTELYLKNHQPEETQPESVLPPSSEPEPPPDLFYRPPLYVDCNMVTWRRYDASSNSFVRVSKNDFDSMFKRNYLYFGLLIPQWIEAIHIDSRTVNILRLYRGNSFKRVDLLKIAYSEFLLIRLSDGTLL